MVAALHGRAICTAVHCPHFALGKLRPRGAEEVAQGHAGSRDRSGPICSFLLPQGFQPRWGFGQVRQVKQPHHEAREQLVGERLTGTRDRGCGRLVQGVRRLQAGWAEYAGRRRRAWGWC